MSGGKAMRSSAKPRYVGSVLFALWLAISTPVFSLIAILSSPLPPLWRYWLIARWSVLAIMAARIFCGIQWRAEGLENLPAKPCVLLSRHESAWETVAYQVIFPPQSIVLKKELLRIPFFGWGLARMSPIAIDRSAGRRALRELAEQGRRRLEAGFYVVVFPEGTRMAPGERADYHPGGAWLAKQTGMAAAVSVDSGKCWPKNSFWKYSGSVVVRVSPPFNAAALSVQEINSQVRAWIEEGKNPDDKS